MVHKYKRKRFFNGSSLNLTFLYTKQENTQNKSIGKEPQALRRFTRNIRLGTTIFKQE